MIQEKKRTPKEIKVTAYMSFLTMMILMSAGIYSILREPDIITNREIVMLPNDSFESMNSRITYLEAENSTLQTIAEVRAQLLYQLTSPIQDLTDSLLSLSRVSVTEAKGIHTDLIAYQTVQENRHTAVMGKLDKEPEAVFITDVVEMPAVVVRDTVYATLPAERRNFWERVRDVFKSKK